MKVLVIGIDGGTWDMIMPLVREGKLPTFKKLIDQGAWGILKSTIPPVTIPAWPAFVTGKNPGKFGVFDFLIPDENNLKGRIARSYDIKSKKIWNYLEHFGKKSIIINLPLSYPLERINGIMITGMLTPEGGKFVHPEEVENIVRKFNYRIEVDSELVSKYWDSPQFVNELIDTMNARCDLATHFLENYEWDFFFILFRETDVVQHKLYKQREKVAEIYINLDRVIASILSCINLEETIVLLMSDHGFSPFRKKFYVNNFLYKLGVLKTKKNSSTKKLNMFQRALLKLGLTQQRILTILKKLKLVKVVYKLIPVKLRSEIPVTTLGIDFEKSKAYSGGHFTSEATYILINKSLVDKSEYESLREYIMESLLNLKDPETGESIVFNVFKGEELFRGEFSANAPDIVMLLNKGYAMVTHVTEDLNITENVHLPAGTHDIDGIVLFYGKGIKETRIYNASIYDLAPTILHIFGLPIPNDMDGRVLIEVFREDSKFAQREPKYVDPKYYTELSEKEKIKSVIKDLKLKNRV